MRTIDQKLDDALALLDEVIEDGRKTRRELFTVFVCLEIIILVSTLLVVLACHR